MSEFTDMQQQLESARKDKSALKSGLVVRREKLAGLQEKKKLIVRQSDPTERDKLTASLTREIGKLEKEIGDGFLEVKKVDDRIGKLLSALEDPVKGAARMDDSYPLLLFPVRLETRFKTTGGNNELWVRVYPDDCNVDAREEMMSESELLNARNFWIEWWKSGGIEQQERGAWRALVDSHGSGRSAWITEKYKPDTGKTGAGEPSKENKEDIILTVLPEGGVLLSASEFGHIQDYWADCYRAAGDEAGEQEAFDRLAGNVGQSAAEEMIQKFRPVNLDEDPPAPHTRDEAEVKLALLYLEDPGEGVSQMSWTAAPVARGLPDRFVAVCCSGESRRTKVFDRPVTDNLAVGPDPGLPKGEQIEHEDGDLKLNEELQWMVDFNKAEEAGMATRISLAPGEVKNGFDRLIVVGLRLSAPAAAGSTLLGELFTSHFHSSDGMGLLRQGTPTNNTEDGGSGFTWLDNADESYDRIFNRSAAFEETNDYAMKSDGQVLAEYLGIDPQLLMDMPNAGGRDRSGAIAMNTALFPATLGYFMEEMMHPVFSSQDIEGTRWFFPLFVSGRGPLPALRIGSQPYGIHPASVFSRLRFGREGYNYLKATAVMPGYNYLERLKALLMKMDEVWDKLLPQVSHTGKEGDPHQVLLDILGLHSGSVEFHQRYFETLQHLYNKAVMIFGSKDAVSLSAKAKESAEKLMEELGFDLEKARPRILDMFFRDRPNLLKGPLIDDRPLSESEAIRAYAGDMNYIELLITRTFEEIRTQNFGVGAEVPAALLYLLLRHALMQSVAGAGTELMVNAKMIPGKEYFFDPSFINIQQAGAATGGSDPSVQQAEAGRSKFEHLYSAVPQISGNDLLVNHIFKDDILKLSPETRNLRAIRDALDKLKEIPTAALERLFAEHLDTCSYRLDAWKSGLVNFRMYEQLQRRWVPGEDELGSEGEGRGQYTRGIHLGAWGFLHDVRPAGKMLTSVELDQELADIFNRNGQPPLMSDSTNLGFIHAPSLNQAATAAILRNAFETGGGEDAGNPFAVNLSSDRVRLANSFLEGLRNGQSLSALLGYQFERGLHDGYSLGRGEVDKFIYPLRNKFPLVSGNLRSTDPATDDNKEFVEEENVESIEAVEARNVIDGLKLIEHVRKPGKKGYPFGFPTGTEPGRLPVATAKEKKAIDDEVDRIMNIHDAISDMVISEEVYQAVLGNMERAAGTADAFSKGTYPPEIEVVNTPRSGATLTQRVAVHFDAEASRMVSPYDGSGDTAGIEMTPRSAAEAAVNKWLSAILPDPARTGCRVTWSNPLSQNNTLMVTQEDLGLQPLDLIHMFDPGMEQSLSALDDRIVNFIRAEKSDHPNTTVKIEYTAGLPVEPGGSEGAGESGGSGGPGGTEGSGGPGGEGTPEGTGEPEAPGGAGTPPEGEEGAGPVSFFELASLLGSLRNALTRSRPLVQSDMVVPTEPDMPGTVCDIAGLEERLNEVIAVARGLRDELDNLIDEADTDTLGALAGKSADLFSRAGLLTTEQTGTGFIRSGINDIYSSIFNRLDKVAERWEQKGADYDAAIASYEAAPDEEKIQYLRVAEGIISTAFTEDPGSDHTAYRAVVEMKKSAFDAVLVTLEELRTNSRTEPEEFLVDCAGAIAGMADHDLTPFDEEYESRMAVPDEEEGEGGPPGDGGGEEGEGGSPGGGSPDGGEVDEGETDPVLRERDMAALLKKDIKTAAANLKKQFEEAIAGAEGMRDEAAEAAAGAGTAGGTGTGTSGTGGAGTGGTGGASGTAAAPGNAEAAALLTGAVKKIMGEDTIILPRFRLSAIHDEEINNTYENSEALLQYIRDKEGRAFPVDDWLYGTARVREKVGRWENITILAEAFNEGVRVDLTPMQLPFMEDDRWLAMRFRDEKDLEDDPENYYRIGSDKLLYTAHHAVPFRKDSPLCGILLDEWTEVIPEREETTGLAFHYDQPGSEPPQSMLLLVPPEFRGSWKWDDIVDSIEETFENARKRAVEPAHLGGTAYGHLLPATMMAVTLYWITMATNLAMNNDIYKQL